MSEEKEYATGHARTPESLGAVIDVGPALGTNEADLPADYIVPAYRHWFDGEYRPIRDNVNTLKGGIPLELKRDGSPGDRNQAHIPKCTDMGFSLQKASVEGRPVSSRDGWRRTKQLDLERYGRPLDSYGASGWSAADAYVEGMADEDLVPSEVLSGETSIQHQQVEDSKQIRESRKMNRGKKAYIVYRPDFARALFETEHPIVTHCSWFTRDNAIGWNGNSPFMTMPEGSDAGGHMFGCIGWFSPETVKRVTGITITAKRAYIMPNSWSRFWGWSGMFLVTDDAVFQRIGGEAWIHVDADTATLAELLARYNDRDLAVTGTPDLYRCELGVLRKYPNEVVWWSHGKAFGFGTYDMPIEDFEKITKGPDMQLGYLAETIRQSRQSVGRM